MGIRGHIQTTQPEYDGACITSYIGHAVYRYLQDDAGLTIYTDGDYGEDADHWEIEISDFDKVKDVAKHLHDHPDAMDRYFTHEDDKEFVGQERGEEVAIWLDNGIEVAKKKGYWTINIDWF